MAVEGASVAGTPAWSAQGRALAWVGACALVLFVPTWLTLYHAVWQTDSQGHGPIILALAGWLIWREGRRLWDEPSPPAVAVPSCRPASPSPSPRGGPGSSSPAAASPSATA